MYIAADLVQVRKEHIANHKFFHLAISPHNFSYLVSDR
jgi:hypothetical protein